VPPAGSGRRPDRPVGQAAAACPRSPAGRCNVFDPALSQPLPDGLVITVEPLVAAGGPRVRMHRDGWTVSTVDGSLSAHSEHTIVVREGAPLLLTA